MLTDLLAVFFRVVSQYCGTPTEQCSFTSLGWCLTFIVGIILTRLAVAVLLNGGGSLSLLPLLLNIHSHSLLSLFNWNFPLAPCGNIIGGIVTGSSGLLLVYNASSSMNHTPRINMVGSSLYCLIWLDR